MEQGTLFTDDLEDVVGVVDGENVVSGTVLDDGRLHQSAVELVDSTDYNPAYQRPTERAFDLYDLANERSLNVLSVSSPPGIEHVRHLLLDAGYRHLRGACMDLTSDRISSISSERGRMRAAVRSTYEQVRNYYSAIAPIIE